MANNDYEEYNNYSQRDKESMRTAADDKLVEQTDDVESKLTSIDTSTTAIKSDVATIKADTATIKTDVGNIKTNVGTIKTDTALIKTHVQTIQSNTGQVENYLSSILNAVSRLAIKTIPESVTLAPGEQTTVFVNGADLHDAQVYVEGFSGEVIAQIHTGGMQYIEVIADNMANPGSGILAIEFGGYGPGERTYIHVPITVTGSQQ